MVSGCFYLPKHKPNGQDAHFICAKQNTIGVADGVGGWDKKGVDAGKYSRRLMINAVISVLRNKHVIKPRHVLREAYNKTRYVVLGSSTACIVTLRDGNLDCVNVGDSGFLLFERNRLCYRSLTRQTGYNRPCQLGNGSDYDLLHSVDEMRVLARPGDVIVLGTDGLLDNLFPAEIGHVLEANSTATPRVLASKIAHLALHKSRDKCGVTPFSEAAKMAGINRPGGKIDDISVIVSRISLAVEASDSGSCWDQWV
ncbi:hypothetical protein M0R45_017685 [Rubus argutus]|uniref:Protein phosphatase n=1 Tax=Rubus argutus TaxID=59490 RepID=A0AAW1XZR2_RUBAR